MNLNSVPLVQELGCSDSTMVDTRLETKDTDREELEDSGSYHKKSCVHGFLGKWKDPERRKLYMKTSLLVVSYWCLGFTYGLRGPAFLDLQIITHTDIEQASFFFTCFSGGYMLGAPVAGALYDHFSNSSLLLVLSMLGLAGTTIATPWCSLYPLMLVVHFIAALFASAMDTAVNSEMMKLWGKEAGVSMQCLHFNFGFGSIISPLVTTPFLTPISEEDTRNVTASVFNRSDLGWATESVLNRSECNNTEEFYFETESYNETKNTSTVLFSTSPPLTTDVHYAYLISGLIVCLATIPHTVRLFAERRPNRRERKTEEKNDAKRQLPRRPFLLVCSVSYLFFFLVSITFDTFATFLTSFLVTHLHWSKAGGAELFSVMWAAIASGSFLAILALRVLSCSQLLLVCCSSIVVSTVGFLFFTQNGITPGLWVCTLVFGMMVAPTFPTCFAWMEQNMIRTTGQVISVAFVASSLGPIVSPIAVGYMLQHWSPMWYCYLVLGMSVLLCTTLICLLIIARHCVRPHQSRNPPLELTIDPSSPENDILIKR